MNVYVFKWTNGIPFYAGKLLKVKGKRIYYFPFIGKNSEELNKVNTDKPSFCNRNHLFGTFNDFEEAKKLYEKIEVSSGKIEKIEKQAREEIESEIEELKLLSGFVKDEIIEKCS